MQPTAPTAPTSGPARVAPRRSSTASSGAGGVGWAAFRYLRTMAPVVLLWHLLSAGVGNPAVLPPPLVVFGGLVELVTSGELAQGVLASLSRLAVAYLLAVLVCVPLGVLLGASTIARELIDPVIELLRPISGIAWIPLALILFGVGDALVVFVIFYGAAFPLVLNTVDGVRRMDRSLTAAARTFGLSRANRLLHVTLPASLPTILVGCRIAMGTAWMSLIAAELVGAPTGIGFSVEWYRELLMTPKMIASVLVIGLLGFLSDLLLRLLIGRVTPWAVDVRQGGGR